MRSLLMALALFFPAHLAYATSLVLATEPYPPFVMVEGGKATGSGITLVGHIMDKTGQDYRIEVMPWARAITLAEKEPMHCVFAAARTSEREKLFKWVEPIVIVRSFLISKASSAVRAARLDDAKGYIIGTHRDDFSQTLLSQLGFQRIDIAADFNLTLRKLLNDRIDAMPMTEETYDTLIARGEKLKKVVLLAEERLGIACHLSVDDGLIAAMQANLDQLTASGATRRILTGGQ